VVITILCDVVADVVDVNVNTHPLTSDDRKNSYTVSWKRMESGRRIAHT